MTGGSGRVDSRRIGAISRHLRNEVEGSRLEDDCDLRRPILRSTFQGIWIAAGPGVTHDLQPHEMRNSLAPWAISSEPTRFRPNRPLRRLTGFASNKATMSSPSTISSWVKSQSHAVPIPSQSSSVWLSASFGPFGTRTQLSNTSGTPSPSKSLIVPAGAACEKTTTSARSQVNTSPRERMSPIEQDAHSDSQKPPQTSHATH